MEKRFNWDTDRNRQLLEERDVSFEDVVFYIQQGCLKDILRYTNQDRLSQQYVLAVEIDFYIYLIPYIETEDAYFLQSIMPSRKATQQYLGDRG